MSSCILSEQYNVRDFGVIFAGAQKNIGPAGMTVVIVRRDLTGRARRGIPKVMDWKAQTDASSMLNTPPTYSIYMAGLCMKWLQRQGGVEAIEKVNLEKAQMLYDFLDESRLFRPTADKAYRSRMNVTFKTDCPETDARFTKEAAAHALVNLKGHRLTGGLRASLYNAMPVEGVRALIDFMKQFEAKERQFHV
jgi:phosphoserine aminotransferase